MRMIFRGDRFLKWRSPFDVPQEQPEIARRFNAGFNCKPRLVPQGRLKTVPRQFSRPCGTHSNATAYTRR